MLSKEDLLIDHCLSETLKMLRSSPAILNAKAKFVLATGEAKICKFPDLRDLHWLQFGPLR